MNKEKEILKISIYDKFKCIADRCRFTCCEGWDISIDTDTYKKLKKENDKCGYILNHIKTKNCGDAIEYCINKETYESCPFLDDRGLCQIVKSNGEEYLSLTCHMFPRIENVFGDRKELSLSCACPEVVELISNITGNLNMNLETYTNLKSDLLELKIRQILINIMKQENFLIEDKLLISFQMLLDISENEIFRNKNSREDSCLEELEKYKNVEYIQEIIDMYKEIDLNINESIEEINYLFLDIIQNYKEVNILNNLLKDISDFAKNIKIESLSDNWHDYKILFEQYNEFIKNCIVSKILSSCVSNDIEDMAISYEMIIIEYLLIRYSVFLKYLMNKNKEINIEDIKDYIVAFSRIISNNSEAVIEFFKEGFGDSILEIGYLYFITLF